MSSTEILCDFLLHNTNVVINYLQYKYTTLLVHYIRILKEYLHVRVSVQYNNDIDWIIKNYLFVKYYMRMANFNKVIKLLNYVKISHPLIIFYKQVILNVLYSKNSRVGVLQSWRVTVG